MIEIIINNRTRKISKASIKIGNKEFIFIDKAAKLIAHWSEKKQNKLNKFIEMLNGENNKFKVDS